MIKLITQFDNEKTKLSLATPTCGCCCCSCCCCIISTFATASISARNFGNYVEEQLPNEPQKAKRARRFGFWLPIGLLVSLAIGLWLIDTFKLNILPTLFAAGIAYLFIMIFLLKKKINLPGITLRVVGFLILLCLFEVLGFFLGLLALTFYETDIYSTIVVFYFFAIPIVSVKLICWAFEKKYDGLNNISNTKNNRDLVSNNQLKKNIDSIQSINNVDKTANEVIHEKTSSKVQLTKKKCSNHFEEDDEK